MTFLLQSVHMALVLELTQREVQCAWDSKCPHHSLPQQPENIIGPEEDPLVKDRHFINLSFHQFFTKVLWPGDQEACGSDFGTTWFKLPVCSQTLSRYCSEQKKIKNPLGSQVAAALPKSTVQSIQHGLSGKAFLWNSCVASRELFLFFSESAYVEWTVRQGDCQKNNTSKRILKEKTDLHSTLGGYTER